ncbi:MAG: flagellar basal body-associated FliL family protein [Thermoanaerobacteraceae bacterium]|nr:flagellar basal body-associated FliL family protein [Thermoanaerobacteraceae bacterium]
MKKNMLIIILIVIIIALGGSFFYFSNNSKPKPIEYYNYSPGKEFVTNLKGDNKFIRAVIEFQVTDKTLLDSLQKENPKIRDVIIQILRNKSSDDIDGAQGQLKLQNEIKTEVNKIIGSDKIKNVYFDDFIVQ